MTRFAVQGVRAALVLTFLLAMPILALPPVAAWFEARLYPPPARRRVVAARPAPAELAPTSSATPLGERTPLPWVAPVAYESLAEPNEPTAPPESSAAQRDLDQLAAVIQSLGATYYRLEQVASPAGHFRFSAELQAAGDPPQRRQYSATASSPELAMQQVIDQMRAGR